jgi:hypothetical protein
MRHKNHKFCFMNLHQSPAQPVRVLDRIAKEGEHQRLADERSERAMRPKALPKPGPQTLQAARERIAELEAQLTQHGVSTATPPSKIVPGASTPAPGARDALKVGTPLAAMSPYLQARALELLNGLELRTFLGTEKASTRAPSLSRT